MRKSLKTMIVGLGTLALLSGTAYAGNSKYTAVRKDIKELHETLKKINGNDDLDLFNNTFQNSKYGYAITISYDQSIELSVTDIEQGKYFKFQDRDSNNERRIIPDSADGILDVYVSTLNKRFTKDITPKDKWAKLEKNYHRFLKDVLPLAKKDLKDKYSNLDEDLKMME
ncbi:MAG: hypothetical protein KKA79_09215 [Nanoarchaeota archaeon]|nr:hypothetical protein [Nanoarchaeota archaeon]MCG2717347.1 hypothetical protein [Nanoarchaeota archaeon]